MRMLSTILVAGLSFSVARAAPADVSVSMPPPPTATTADESDVGTIAMMRYRACRSAPRDVYGPVSWRSYRRRSWGFYRSWGFGFHGGFWPYGRTTVRFLPPSE